MTTEALTPERRWRFAQHNGPVITALTTRADLLGYGLTQADASFFLEYFESLPLQAKEPSSDG